MNNMIIEAIAMQHPFRYDEVKSLYEQCKSYDRTIFALIKAVETGEYPEMFLSPEPDKGAQICYKTNETCKYDCEGLCRDSC